MEVGGLLVRVRVKACIRVLCYRGRNKLVLSLTGKCIFRELLRNSTGRNVVRSTIGFRKVHRRVFQQVEGSEF